MPPSVQEEEMNGFLENFKFAWDIRAAFLEENSEVNPRFWNYEENDDSKYAYALVVDYNIDEDAKLKTDDLPLTIHNKIEKPRRYLNIPKIMPRKTISPFPILNVLL